MATKTLLLYTCTYILSTIVVLCQRDTFSCTDTTEDTCIIDANVHFPNGYGQFINHSISDIICDSKYPNCIINCIGGSICGVSNHNRNSYLSLYCQSIPGSCEINASGNFAMKYAKVYGNDYNTLTLSFTDLAAPHYIYGPYNGGNLIINANAKQYGNSLILVLSNGDKYTHNVILTYVSGSSNIIDDINAADIDGHLNITTTAMWNRNIYCPNDPNKVNSQCNINCIGDCSNLNVYTNDGMPYDVHWICNDSLNISCYNAKLFCKPQLTMEVNSSWIYDINNNKNIWKFADTNCLNLPTRYPTQSPIYKPTFDPTYFPSHTPTDYPTFTPTNYPTFNPTFQPTFAPTNDPTIVPTNNPSFNPVYEPTFNPTNDPTHTPTANPSETPSMRPTLLVHRTPKPTVIATTNFLTVNSIFLYNNTRYNIEKNKSNINYFEYAFFVVSFVFVLCVVVIICLYVNKKRSKAIDKVNDSTSTDDYYVQLVDGEYDTRDEAISHMMDCGITVEGNQINDDKESNNNIIETCTTKGSLVKTVNSDDDIVKTVNITHGKHN